MSISFVEIGMLIAWYFILLVETDRSEAFWKGQLTQQCYPILIAEKYRWIILMSEADWRADPKYP